MPDKITPFERKLIDERVAARKVTECPPCTFAIDQSVGVDWRKEAESSYRSQKAGRRALPENVKVRTALTEMKQGATTVAQISEATGESAEKVIHQASYLRKRGYRIEFAKVRKAKDGSK